VTSRPSLSCWTAPELSVIFTPGGEFHEGWQGGLPTHEACNRDLHFIKSEITPLLA